MATLNRLLFPRLPFRTQAALLCAALMASGDAMLLAQSTTPSAPAQTTSRPPVDTKGGDAAPLPADPAKEEAKAPADQLESLVAPIALYPDPLLSQTLVASTYPLEIVQLQQWLEKNKGLKDEALVEAVKKQGWDPSIQAMAPLPDVVKLLAGDIKWTTDLGNAFLAQQADVMDAVQRMRQKAMDKGNLKTTEQQKVATQTVESKTVIVIEQADPQVIYVPTYDPVIVYGAPPYYYPYPPLYYPPPYYYGGGVAIGFTMGIMMGAAWHGGWGYHCGWGHNDVNINVNNNFVNHYDRNNNVSRGNNSNWSHDSKHRGAAPYSNKSTAQKYGGGNRSGASAGAMDRGGSGAGNRGGGGAPSAGTMDRGGSGAGNRGGGGAPSAGSMDRGGGSSYSGMGGGDRVGNQSVSSKGSGSKGSAFSGASSGRSGSSTRASSSRGSSSMGRSRGGGGGRGRR
jgi:hypothetical protein